MLPICFGFATRLSGYLLDATKSYRVTAELGAATETGDADGKVIERLATPIPAEHDVRAALHRFRGESEQIPPMHSALKQGGVRLYELARRGVEVPREARRIRIDALELEHYAWPELRFTVRCSKGTYVRSLVIDIAAALGTLGHVRDLRRLSVGLFAADGMSTLDALEALEPHGTEALDRLLLPPDAILVGWPKVEVRGDLGVATVYFSTLALDEDVAAIKEGFEQARGCFRSRVGKELQLRRVPELRFRHDTSARRAVEIGRLIDDSNAQNRNSD
jgi:tRNA pseudouridine55 synthase